MKRFIIFTLFAICLLQAPYAQATTVVSFEDNAVYWDGFENTYRGGRQNSQDVIGTPDLTGGNFIYDGHTLTGIELYYTSTSRAISPGDWFFDFDQDQNWDYVLHQSVQHTRRGSYLVYNLYNVDGWGLGYGDEASWYWKWEYQESYGRGGEIRYDHPVKALIPWWAEGEAVDFSGWDYGEVSEDSPGKSVWSGIDLDLLAFDGASFTYGFAMTCANDVLFGQSMVPAPEPSTFLLLGFGGLGLLLYRRKKSRSL
ncbi:PEP-CTERM sorting domain-containing protein [uncultured Pseudodesulfovibrio sp.]|uniref:PEP-CTERM sorting domain-containing protein n=1 Tax=uncultured Pseudodesulfovibrio sp. TaxID=2035858 RepID=UPI0029C7A5FA|nr:PEP-CTERM sorting domain-containing protein [uncultured Pseudodesulfovibrio sp.]